jgi:hypothetical protein
MGSAFQRRFAFLFLAMSLLGCSATIQNASLSATDTSTSSYACNYFSGYDSLAACETASVSNCSSTWESFPTGGVALCYFPPSGYQACLVTPPAWDWIYTPYSDWCDTGTTSGPDEVYKKTRSVISCSSALCYCNNPQVTTQTCAGAGAGAGQCGSFAPNPLTEMPAPSACP